MKVNRIRASAAILVLAVCVSIVPVTSAAPLRKGEEGFGGAIIRFVDKKFQKIRKILRITTLEDFPTPPKP
jgi:hypothetical protein